MATDRIRCVTTAGTQVPLSPFHTLVLNKEPPVSFKICLKELPLYFCQSQPVLSPTILSYSEALLLGDTVSQVFRHTEIVWEDILPAAWHTKGQFSRIMQWLVKLLTRSLSTLNAMYYQLTKHTSVAN